MVESCKMIALLRKFHILTQHSLLTMYKTFVGPHLDYDDVIYDKVFNQLFHKKIASVKGYLRYKTIFSNKIALNV